MNLARALGGVAIGLLILAALLGLVMVFGGDGVTGEISFGGIFWHLVLLAIEGYWLYAFALSPKAKMYFVNKHKDHSVKPAAAVTF